MQHEGDIFFFHGLWCFVLFLSQNNWFRKNDPVNFLRRVDFLLLAVLIYLIYLKFDCSEQP